MDAPDSLKLIVTRGPSSYALLDTGHGRKLERFGGVIVDRPEPQAMWQPALEAGAWQRADAVFKGLDREEEADGGRWRSERPLPESWPARVLGVTALCRLTNFRHLGLFPEQLPLWQWMLGELAKVEARCGLPAPSPDSGVVAANVAMLMDDEALEDRRVLDYHIRWYENLLTQL